MQEIIVGIIVAGAILFTVKSFVNSSGEKEGCGCGGCPGCSSENQCLSIKKNL